MLGILVALLTTTAKVLKGIKCAPTSQGGVIVGRQILLHHSPFRWDPVAHAWVGGEVPVDHFMSLPIATPAELSAAGLQPVDFRRLAALRRSRKSVYGTGY
jgi:hypothetical protein